MLSATVSLLSPLWSVETVSRICVIFPVLTLLYLAYTFIIWPRFFSPLRHIPLAPDSHWFWGHLLRIMREPAGAPARDWIDTVPNKGLIRYHMWFADRIIVTQPETIAEAMVTRNYDWEKSSLVRYILRRFTGNGILLAEGDDHRSQRRNLMPAFAFRHVKDLAPVFLSKARELVYRLERVSTDDRLVDAGQWASRATLDVIGVSSMGMEFGSLHNPDNALAQAYEDVFARPISTPSGRRLQLLNILLPSAIVTRIPIKHNIVINNSVAHIRKTCQDIIDRRRRQMSGEEKASPDLSILSVALQSGGFTDRELIDQMMTFLAAGHETIATALVIAIYLMCRHPDVQGRLRDDIRANIPSLSHDFSSADTDACQYLQAVTSEIMRIWPPVAMTFRTASCDTSLGGHFIPKGTNIVFSPWAVNASKQLWGDDALEFRPERWLDAQGRANSSGSSSSNYSNLTFLHGPRSCIGQRFAQDEFACLLAAWIGSFDASFEPGSALARGDVELKGSVTVKPKGGVWCRLRKVPGWE